MLSERPGSLTAGLGGSAGPSIGNYKGVMLCNRPFGGVTAPQKQAAMDGAAAVAVGRFVAGVVKSEPGYSCAPKVRDAAPVKQSKKKSALSRHRQWLSDLQKTKDALEQHYLEETLRKEAQSRKFAEREAKIRHDYIGAAHNCGDAAESDEEHVYDAESALPKPSKARDDGDIGVVGAGKSKKRGISKRPVMKPLWALTEQSATAATEQAEEDEVSELLAFTRDLDFDKYIRDAEVQSMIDQVKKRIQELEKQEQRANDAAAAAQPEVDDSVDGDSESHPDDRSDVAEAAMAKRVMRLTDANLRRIGKLVQSSDAAAGPREDDAVSVAMSIAKTVMSEGGRSVRDVHSTKSLAAVVERSQAKLAGIDEQASQAESLPVAGMETAVNVKIIMHKDDGGLRLGGKNTVSNLPYIHRNPAI